MATVKKDFFGKLSGGRGEAAIYTIRNTKGNELKVTDYGARIVSLRFRDKDFTNKFMLKTFDNVSGYEQNPEVGIVYVDDGDAFSKIVWDSEQITEGVKFTAEVDGKKAQIIYGISNDNELSIRYEGEGLQDISTQLTFSADALPDSDITPFAEGAEKGKLSGKQVYNIIDKPAEVEFVEGMFGYDFGCPIDYFEAGLKNAADIFSAASSILLQIYASQNHLHVEDIGEGFSVKTSGTKSTDGKIKSQTVYIFKNRK